MSCAGFQRAVALSRRSPAAFLLLALACSGPTDIVGVVDDEGSSGAADEPASDATAATPAGDPSADDDASDADEVVLLLAGRPVTDWPGEALEWPLSVSLEELFASARANDRSDRLLPAPWPSRRVASGFTRSSSRDIASDVDGRSPELDARRLILSASDARRLLALMAPAGGPGERAGVFRDALGDVYRVSVENEGRSLDPAECDRVRREPFECAGNGPFD